VWIALHDQESSGSRVPAGAADPGRYLDTTIIGGICAYCVHGARSTSRLRLPALSGALQDCPDAVGAGHRSPDAAMQGVRGAIGVHRERSPLEVFPRKPPCAEGFFPLSGRVAPQSYQVGTVRGMGEVTLVAARSSLVRARRARTRMPLPVIGLWQGLPPAAMQSCQSRSGRSARERRPTRCFIAIVHQNPSCG
jgi:hypothetical protein